MNPSENSQRTRTISFASDAHLCQEGRLAVAVSRSMDSGATAGASLIRWLRQRWGAGPWPLRDGRVSWDWGTRPRIRFQKYHVAPRLGTDKVRRRILLGVREATARILSGTSLT